MNKYIVLAITATVVCGCLKNDPAVEPSKDPGVYVGENAKPMSELADGDVFLIVNQKKFTKSEYLENLGVFDKMLRMGHKVPLTGFNAKAAEAVEKISRSVPSRILRRELVTQFAKKSGIEPNAKHLKEVSSGILKNINRGHATLDAVCEEMGGQTGACFREFVESEALDMTLRDYFDKDGILNVKEEDIVAYSNRFENSIVESAQKNEEQKVILRQALEELRNGGDFVKVAVKYSDSKDAEEEAKFWDEYYKEDFEGESVLENWAMTAKSGDVSGILELDDGYGIVKLLQVHDESLDPDDDTEKVRVWEFAKLHRDFFEPLPELTHDEIATAIKAERNARMQRLVGEEIMKTAVIEWPYGTNLFENAKN